MGVKSLSISIQRAIQPAKYGMKVEVKLIQPFTTQCVQALLFWLFFILGGTT